MSSQLKISVGQYSDKGRKESNQDFHGAYLPLEPQLSLKGVAIALADGISSSEVSHIASESAVSGFLEDYYCTSETWSVKKSAQRVLMATNSWLYSQTRRSQYRYDAGRGYVCTLSAMIIKAATAHIFHVGDSRVYRLRGRSLEQLTEDHRVSVSPETTYLSRALGMDPQLDIDYQAVPLEQGDIFLLATDGVYEFAAASFIADNVQQHAHDLDAAARVIVAEALERGSTDNLTAQLVRVDALPTRDPNEILQQLTGLPLPPILEARTIFDGYRIVRELHASSRSHVYLAVDAETDLTVIIKTPSIDLQGDPAYLERFLMEEWIARRITSPHVLKPCLQSRRRNFLYIVTEFVDGQTLTQWMIDNPKPELEAVRRIVEQIGKGLQAFHRMEMLHQDTRPDNIMIDATGTVKIIDFGSTRITGVAEAAPSGIRDDILGTVQYTAPEYFLGEPATSRSDLFSLGVITYQMLTGKLPYGAQAAQARTRTQFSRLRYRSAAHGSRDIPVWVDGALERAVHPNPQKRYDSLSELLYDLRHPNAKYVKASSAPLIERNPLLLWKTTTVVLAITVVVLLAMLHGLHR